VNFTPVKTPPLLKHAFSNLIWNIPNSEKIIYLTFDDGPTPEITDWTLKTLKAFDASASFFCIGQNVLAHPDIYKRIITEGHQVGNHSHEHIKGWRSSTKNYIENVEKASIHISSKLFRPPYGQLLPKQITALSQLDYKIIMWTILSLDWDYNIPKEKCAENVITNTSDGDIVVFHDSEKAWNNMQYALPKVLEFFTEKGYKFRRIPESIL
jgi:peptidoglycan/xylan/chitin deacetylase (PgdA/CDA1 family)